MPRVAREKIEAQFYHIMVQGIGKEYVFPDDNCKGFYVSCLQKNKEKYPAKVIAFCVMGNHAHILLAVNDVLKLSKYVQNVNADYARYYNRISKRVGYVFRGRYKSEPITSTDYLINCVAYIQNNPLNAGIVERSEDYKFSSLSNYLCGRGTVDFNEAAKHFDISAENMREIMQELTYHWIEHDDRDYEDKDEILTELIKKYNINSKKSLRDRELARKIAAEIKERSGASLREIAQMLEMPRETLRKLWSGTTSP